MARFIIKQNGTTYQTLKLGDDNFVIMNVPKLNVWVVASISGGEVAIEIHNPDGNYLNIVYELSMDDSGGYTTYKDDDWDTDEFVINEDVSTDTGDAVSAFYLDIWIYCSGYEDYYEYIEG